jgi:hypothetical protein
MFVNLFKKRHVSIQEGILPGAGTKLLTDDISPVRKASKFLIDFCPANTGVLSVVFTEGAVVTAMDLFGGSTLTANVGYPSAIYVREGESVNFKYTGTAAGKYRLIVQEE